MKDFLSFLKTSYTAFHAANNICEILDENGFIKINESDKWNLKENGKYYFTRNSSSVIAFTIPANLDELSYNITAAHLDSPTFKLKPNFKMVKSKYEILNTEVYGGAIYNTWFDRPLNIAGRVMVKNGNKIETKLFSFDKAICMIPNLPIHYNRDVNNGVSLNPQVDTLPIVSMNLEDDLLDLMAKKLNCKKDDILSFDLYLALLDRGCYAGINDEFIMAPQIDNLECSHTLIDALISSNNSKSVNVCALFDNEEIGSRTRQGAASTILSTALERIAISLNKSKEEYLCSLANSFFVSADNAQGYNPAHPEKFDPTNDCHINGGIVIKNAARGSYTTDGASLAYFKMLCDLVGAKYQLNTNRSNIPGGSTLGAISLSSVSIPSIDIGLAQLAMHSAYETAGSYDIAELKKAIVKFYNTHLKSVSDGTFEI